MWIVYDDRGIPLPETSSLRHDDAIVVVLEQFLPSDTFGSIHWGNSYTGNGALYYLWSALLESGWSVREFKETEDV